MIKIQPRPYRQTTAQWVIFEDNEEKTETIRVQYYSLTVKDLKENQEQEKSRNKEDSLWISDFLVKRLFALPDFVDADEKPIEISLEFLESQDINNLKNVFDAINEDENPKSTGDSSPEK